MRPRRPRRCASRCGSPGSAGSTILDRIEAVGRRRLPAPPAARRRSTRPALAWRAWRWPRGMQREPRRAQLTRQERHATSTTPSASCPRRSGARSTRSTRSAAWWTTASTRRAARARRACAAGSPRSTAAYAGRPETELGQRAGGGRRPVPDPARRASRTSWPAAAWTSTTRRYATFADLRVYCERVASAVGLASIEIFGYDDPRTREYAVELGLALQLTNILRDVAADAARDRLYLPARGPRALRRDGGRRCSPRRATPARRGRAGLDAAPRVRGRPRPRRTTRARGARCCRERDRRSMLAAEIMGAVYRALLEEWARRGHPVGGARVQLGEAAQALDRAAHACRACTGAGEGRRRRAAASPGFAAAIALQERRHEVVLLERRGVLGGRATSSRDARHRRGRGQRHPPDGRRLRRDPRPRCGAPGPPTCCSSRTNLQARVGGRRGADAPSTARRSPAPLHLLAGLLGLRVPLVGEAAGDRGSASPSASAGGPTA